MDAINVLDTVNLLLNVTAIILIVINIMVLLIFVNRFGYILSGLSQTLGKLDETIDRQTQFLLQLTGSDGLFRLKK